MTIKDLPIGYSAKVSKVGGEGSLRQHFLDMGIIPGNDVTIVKYAPMGDPVELKVYGYELTLRLEDAAKITVDESTMHEEKSFSDDRRLKLKNHTEHPGFGEEGRYHVKSSENPLSAGTKLTFALLGNQNCGKTTLFNQLTGSNQHVGNFPGVTVDRKGGVMRGIPNSEVTDLPGIYSLSPYTSEEIVSRHFVLTEKPTGIINIVDATNIERNLYLTMQLMELDIPIVLAINMMDELRGNGGSILVNDMEAVLGIPVVPISAAKNEGVDELVHHAVHIAGYQEKPGRTDFCDKDENGGAVHRCLHGIMHLIEDHAKDAEIPVRFAAGKIVEGDELIMEALKLSQNEKEMIEHIICQMEEERGLDRAAAMADMRFSFIHKLCSQTVVRPRESKEHERSTRIDRILTGRFTAIPSFLIIMGMVFYLTFGVIGAFFQKLLASGVDSLAAFLDDLFNKWNIGHTLHSLIVDGVVTGVGSIVSFVPIIVVLFFFLSILEDSGYMARVAFFMDKPLRKLGLSGRSIVPMLIGFGCTVPAVMSSRTLPSARDRKMTILMTPFMSCSAKLPVYGFFTALFFPDKVVVIMIGLYLLGIFNAVLVAYIYKKTIFKGNAVPFVMELPNYRIPGAKNVGHLLWDKARDFLEKAFSVIFLATIIVWFLQSFDMSFNPVSDAKDSILALVSGFLSPIFKPLGFGDFRFSTALITGFIAKESVISTLNILFKGGSNVTGVLDNAAALSMLTFILLYTPCIAAITSIKHELGRKWALFTVAQQCVVAWIVAFAVHSVAVLLGI